MFSKLIKDLELEMARIFGGIFWHRGSFFDATCKGQDHLFNHPHVLQVFMFGILSYLTFMHDVHVVRIVLQSDPRFSCQVIVVVALHL